ncbi:MAG: hypothetical protein F9K48_01690 [Candidatus Brocadia sp.]|nr:MAG: hypothetical protein F9K48_01690 [Candidatus Brocadia sp.]
MENEEVGEIIRSFKKYLPGCVKKVILRGSGELRVWKQLLKKEEKADTAIEEYDRRADSET